MADLYTPRTKDKLKRIALAQLDGILLPQVAADQQRRLDQAPKSEVTASFRHVEARVADF